MPEKHLSCTVLSVLKTREASHFRTAPVPDLHLDLQGIPGDRHYGFTRRAGAREPWFPRGIEIRSFRQLTIVSAEELDEIARRMEIPHLEPGWLGANIMIQNIPSLSLLPGGARFFHSDGAVLVNEGINVPCRFAGAEIARHYPERRGLDRLFPKAAVDLRGLLATVERPGTIAPGSLKIKIPEQKLWTGAILL